MSKLAAGQRDLIREPHPDMTTEHILPGGMAPRTLSPDEYPRLKQLPDGFAPDPENSRAIVVEAEGQIIGRVFLLAPVHVEGPWIAPEHRNGTVGARLIQAVEAEASTLGVTRLFAYAVDHTMEDYLQRLGYTKQPWTVWAKEI